MQSGGGVSEVCVCMCGSGGGGGAYYGMPAP